MRIRSFLAILFVAATAAAQSSFPPDAEIRKILADRIDTQRQGVGIVVGVIDPKGRRVVSYGALAKDDKRRLNGDTLFEIGSATKVFTSLLLADAVQRGEVALTDPVSKFLPSGVTMPQRGETKITLQDLATHTSGLPRLPSNFAPKDVMNPYADYTLEQLYSFLASATLTRDIGTHYEYSNLGAGLLGHVLALRTGMSYEALVTKRILAPLKMKSTTITLSDALRKRLATGHDAALTPAKNWDFPTLAGAGALRSTTNDLLAFLAAELGLGKKSPLAPAITAQHAVRRRPTGNKGLDIALGWHILTTPGGREIVWHNGGTGGYRSFIGFDPKKKTGVVVLSNVFTPAGIDDIGRHLLDASLPLLEPAKTRNEIALEESVLARYVGKYELAPTFAIVVTREGARLFGQATGQPRFEMFAESEREFFLKVVDAQISFQVDGENKVTGMILHQNGGHVPGKKVE